MVQNVQKSKGELRLLAKELKRIHAGEPHPDFVSRIVATDAFANAKSVSMYIPVAGEPDILGLRKVCADSGRDVFVPASDGEGGYHFCLLPPGGSLHRGRHGIPEPAETNAADTSCVGICLVPGVLFDRYGNRLGHGTGCYDRLLSFLPERCVKIGVAYNWQIVDLVPHEPHDVKMDFVLSM